MYGRDCSTLPTDMILSTLNAQWDSALRMRSCACVSKGHTYESSYALMGVFATIVKDWILIRALWSHHLWEAHAHAAEALCHTWNCNVKRENEEGGNGVPTVRNEHRVSTEDRRTAFQSHWKAVPSHRQSHRSRRLLQIHLRWWLKPFPRDITLWLWIGL